MKKIILTLFSIVICINISKAQIIDVVQLHAGVALFPTDIKTNFITGYADNLYAGFSPGQSIGGGVSKFLTDKFQLGIDVEYMRTSKPFYDLNIVKTSLFLKFNIIPPDIYKLSPYIIASGSTLFVGMNQAANSFEYAIPNGYNQANTVQINSITNRDESYNYSALVFGGGIGAGLDYNFYSSYSIFGEVTYSYNLVKSSTLQDSENAFTANNKSQLAYTNIIFGVRIYMY